MNPHYVTIGCGDRDRAHIFLSQILEATNGDLNCDDFELSKRIFTEGWVCFLLKDTSREVPSTKNDAFVKHCVAMGKKARELRESKLISYSEYC